MNRVETCEHAGFCFGVERAVALVERLLEELGASDASGSENKRDAFVRPLYTYGPIIHNEAVVEDFEARGVRILDGPEALKSAAPGTLVIRSHGVSRAEQELMESLGFAVEDATCPFVKAIHRRVLEASEAGRTVFITGDPAHAEVQAIVGWCENRPYVIRDESGIPDLDPGTPVTVVSQTTFHVIKFKKIVENILKRYYNAFVVNTICNATQISQQETEELARKADAMIVIGGSKSSNTRKLVEICEANCARTYYVRNFEDLLQQGFQPVRFVGITAGASTPKNIIEEVQNYVRINF